VGSLNVSLLRPACSVSRENINGAGVGLRVIVLIAIDALRPTVLCDSADCERVTVGAQADRKTKPVAIRELIAHARLTCVRCLEIGLLRPHRSSTGKDVDSSCLWDGVIVLIAVDAFGSAGLARRGNGQSIAVLAERHDEAKLVALSRIRRLDVCLLCPCVVSPHEDVYSASAIQRSVVLVAVDAFCVAAFVRSADCQRVAVATERYAMTFECSAVAK